MVLFFALFVPPMCACLLLAWVGWAGNDFEMLDDARCRSPPMERAWLALLRGGLTRSDYTRLGAAAGFVVSTLLFASLIAWKTAPSWAGLSAGMCVLVLATTWVTLLKFINTNSVRSVAPTSLATLAVLWAYSLWFFLDPLSDARSLAALALLFLALVYPTLVLLLVAVWRLREDAMQLSRFVLIAFALSAALLLTFVIVVFVLVSIVAGFALLFALLLGALGVFLFYEYEKNGALTLFAVVCVFFTFWVQVNTCH